MQREQARYKIILKQIFCNSYSTKCSTANILQQLSCKILYDKYSETNDLKIFFEFADIFQICKYSSNIL